MTAKIRVVPASELSPAKGLKAENYVDERVMPSGLTSEQKAEKLFMELDAATIELLTRKHRERVNAQMTELREQTEKKEADFLKWVLPRMRPVMKTRTVTVTIPVVCVLDYQSLSTDEVAIAFADSKKLESAVTRTTKAARDKETRLWHDFIKLTETEGKKRGLLEGAVERVLGKAWDELRE